jgi:hypothetical protein
MMSRVSDEGKSRESLLPRKKFAPEKKDTNRNARSVLKRFHSAQSNDPPREIRCAAGIRNDFEAYIQAIQNYFRCLDNERARAFQEAREVSEE